MSLSPIVRDPCQYPRRPRQPVTDDAFDAGTGRHVRYQSKGRDRLYPVAFPGHHPAERFVEHVAQLWWLWFERIIGRPGYGTLDAGFDELATTKRIE